MFKVLIVDDEKIVLEAVKFIIDNNFKETVNYETARSGREAIEKVDMLNPDIILMDIRMPGINGIDAIKEIKLIRPNVHFIIVSAYEQFDFAKEAVELKVDDYILKPIIKKNFVEVLTSTMNKIEYERETKKKELENIEKRESIITFLEEGFILSIIMGENNGTKLCEYKQILKIEESGGYIISVEIAEEMDDRRREPNDNRARFSEEAYLLISDAFKCKCKCYVGPIILNHIIVVIPVPQVSDSILKSESKMLAKYIYKRVNEVDGNTHIKIGIGRYKDFENISASLEESSIALKIFNDLPITHIDDINFNNQILDEYPMESEVKLLDKIGIGDINAAMLSFNKIFEWIINCYRNSFEQGRARIIELVVLIYHSAALTGFKEEGHLHYLIELSTINDYIKLENWCKDKLVDIVSSTNLFDKKRNNGIIIRAKEYIYENYKLNITLEDVAKEVNVTPHYLSRLFKEETKENFIDYITSFRMKKAKKMMDTTNLNIKEICYSIGYTDPNYFSRLFKKVEKVTPTDYMKSLNTD